MGVKICLIKLDTILDPFILYCICPILVAMGFAMPHTCFTLQSHISVKAKLD